MQQPDGEIQLPPRRPISSTCTHYTEGTAPALLGGARMDYGDRTAIVPRTHFLR
jgi:hypothetical protein